MALSCQSHSPPTPDVPASDVDPPSGVRQVRPDPEPLNLSGGKVGARSDPRARHSATPLTDAELVVLAREGERWASQALFHRYANLVAGLSYRLLGVDSELEDVVQEAFLQALRNLKKLREPQAFSAWLGSITVRAVRKTIAHRRMLERLGLRRPLEFDDEVNIGISAPPELVIELRSLYRALNRAGTEARLALLLRRVEGCTVSEVASLLGVSDSTAKRRIAEGARVVKFHMEQYARMH